MGTREITKEDVPLSIFDTRGLERAKYKETLRALEKLVQERQKRQKSSEQIHIAWICILEAARRVEDSDIELTARLSKYIPVVVVITQSAADDGFRQKVQELLPQAKNVVRVHAKETVYDDGHRIKAFGLEELIELTMELVPVAVKDAVAASERVNLAVKRQRAYAAVVTAATAAAGVGAVPIPFSDAIALIPIQVGMLIAISVVWGLPVTQSFLMTLVTSTFTSTGGTFVGRTMARQLLKLVPGVGSVINAGVASAMTTAFGGAYITALWNLSKKYPDRNPTAEEVANEFTRQLPKI
jgi:uncharacterized protein (DUF697 family)